jgi:membrane protease YdiL (CAAX protease family)
MRNDSNHPLAALLQFVARLWQRLPVILRAIVLAELIADIGDPVPDLLMLGNLKLSPAIPWLLPATALWLWIFWHYLNGEGWPRSTAESRRRDLRARPLSGTVWFWSLLAGGLAMVSVVGLAFLTTRLANVPRDAFKLPINLSNYPVWTVVSVLLAISAVAGVVEEAAFRGYLISQIQRRHGWIIAILISGVMFFVSHLNHAYVTLPFLPFFLAVSSVHGLLVYLTRSILPSVVLHSAADLITIPIQYGLIGHLSVVPVWESGIDSVFVTYLVLIVAFALLAVPAFRRLISVASAIEDRQGSGVYGSAA